MKSTKAIWCDACGRRCYPGTPGGRWQLAWRVGQGMPHVRDLEPDLTECQVLAKQAPSALPGSYLRLTEVVGERLCVWLHVEARLLATDRLELLRRLETSLDGRAGTEEVVRRWAKHWRRACVAYDGPHDLDLFRTLGVLGDAMESARQEVAATRLTPTVACSNNDPCRELSTDGSQGLVGALSYSWTRAVSAACSEARMLAYAWRSLDPTLAAEFAGVAETLAGKRAPRSMSRVRQAVQDDGLRMPRRDVARRHA